MNLKRKLLPILAMAVIGIFVVLIYQDRYGKTYLYYDFGAPIPESYHLLGIDISHHQGEINWPQVADMKVGRDSIGFVYMKATEGIGYEDDHWVQNAQGAFEAGLPFGLYHFMRPSYSARQQALFFAGKCRLANDTLRPMVDIETNCGYSPQRLIDSVYTFITTFEQQLKMKPIIYTYESFYNDYFANSYLQHEWFWIANYNGQSRVAEKENVVVWQFSETGTVNGIPSKVDLNVAKRNFDEVMYQD